MLLRAQNPEDGLGPYSLMFLFAGGVIFSTFALNLFFMNLPVWLKRLAARDAAPPGGSAVDDPSSVRLEPD